MPHPLSMKAAQNGLVPSSWLAGSVISLVGGEKTTAVCVGSGGPARVSIPSLGDIAGF